MDVQNLKMTTFLNVFSFFKLPLIAFCTPKVIEMSDQKTEIRIRLGYRTRNHLNSMYFGALAIGAELSIALKAIDEIQKSGERIDFIFQDFQASFLKRADGHTHFRSLDAMKVTEMVRKAKDTDERLYETFTGEAFVPGKSEEPIMTYKLTLSVKKRSKK